MNSDKPNSDYNSIKFLEFINRLTNPEKTRNFNRFHAYSLAPFQECMEKFQKPSKTKLKVSIVGTNGKGSLAHYLNKLLQNYGKVGLYTSPHLISPLERIRTNSEDSIESELDEILYDLSLQKGTMEYLEKFSYFEIFTLFSYLYFHRQSCEYEIYEAGLGGRLDATKLLDCEIVALTKIDLDHTEILGNDPISILKEKLGIIGPKSKILFALEPDDDLQRKLILEYTKERKIPVYFFKNNPTDNNKDHNYLYLYFQMANFILETLVREKFLDTKVPVNQFNFADIPRPQARLEKLHEHPTIIYDTGHNPHACINALNDLHNNYPNKQWDCIIGSLPDKDSNGIFEGISSIQNISNLQFLDYSPFRKPTNPSAKSLDSEQKFIFYLNENIKNKVNTLVMGSFRIYPIVRNVLLRAQSN